MAEQNDGQERTEEATPRKREQALEQGQVPRSRDLTTTVLLLGAAGMIMLLAPYMVDQLVQLAHAAWRLEPSDIRSPDIMFRVLRQGVWMGLLAALPVILTVTVAGVVSGMLLGGVTFNVDSLMPKFSRIDPLAGLARMLSMNALVELAKAVLKLVAVSVPVFFILTALTDDLLALDMQSIQSAMAGAVGIVGWGFLAMAAATMLIAMVDVPWQLYSYAQKLKMSFQEIQEEMKDTDGRPEVKSRIRRLQQEMSRKRMLADVPQADVIITNPDHYAVALKYDADKMEAPRVLAKGVDFLASRIRQAATENNIAIVQTPALARAVYFSTEVGAEIPKGLYLAVARVLAYVLQLNRYRIGIGAVPQWPDDLPIPDDLRHD